MNRRRFHPLIALVLACALHAPDSIAAPGKDRLYAVMPGQLVDYAVVAGEHGTELWFLVHPEDYPQGEPGASSESEESEPAEQEEKQDDDRLPICRADDPNRKPRELYFLDMAGGGSLQQVRSDLPWNTGKLAVVDLDGDGQDELLVLGKETGLQRFDGDRHNPETELVRILEDANPVWPENGGTFVAVPGLGTLSIYRYDIEAGSYVPHDELTMPVEASVQGDRIRLVAQQVRPINLKKDGLGIFATRPKAFGTTRLRTILLNPEGAEGERTLESWSGLPEPEDVMETFNLVLDGAPALLVTTKEAGKLGLFAEKRLRLYRLEEDRSRAGRRPVFATVSNMNIWQEAVPFILDINQDGREDLVIGYWKGLKDDRVVLEVYLRGDDGGFGKARTTAFDVEEADRSFVAFGQDLDGDNLPDLLVGKVDELLLFPGRHSPNGKKVVANKPATRYPLKNWDTNTGVMISIGTEGTDIVMTIPDDRSCLLDIDQDGVPEILITTGASSCCLS